MPSVIEELPREIAYTVVKVFGFCKQKIMEYQQQQLEEEKQRRWNNFLGQTRFKLMKLVKEQISDDQFDYELQPDFENQEIIQADGSKSIYRIRIEDKKVPICEFDKAGREFQVACIVFRFTIFGELDSDILLKMKEKWVYYMKNNGLYGIADTYKKDDLHRLVFIIYEKINERAVKSALFHLKNSQNY